MSIQEITDTLEVLAVNFAKLTHQVQKFAAAQNKEPEVDQNYVSVPSFKIIIVGDTKVGKTTFTQRHLKGEFTEKTTPTLGVEVNPIGFNTTYGPVGLNFWDCAGDEEMGGLKSGYYAAANAAIVMYDVANLESFTNTEMWIEKVRKVCPDIPIVVVGNKMDATGFGGLRSTAWNKDLKHYYVSSKSKYNIPDPIQYLLRILMKRNDLKIE